MGLRARPWPTFRPLDVTLPSTTSAAPTEYKHWGSYLNPSTNRNISEPDGGQVPQQLCGAANFSQSYGPPASAGPPAFEVNGSAAGWSDVSCSARLPFMCRLLGELWAGCGRTHGSPCLHACCHDNNYAGQC
jgi:hypothetical protein